MIAPTGFEPVLALRKPLGLTPACVDPKPPKPAKPPHMWVREQRPGRYRGLPKTPERP